MLVYEYDEYTKPELGADPNKWVETKEGVVYYYNGRYSEDGENWISAVPDATAKQIKFELKKEYLGTYNIRYGKTFTANVTAEQAEKILGISVSCDDNGVDITIVHDGSNLRQVSVSYTTDNAQITSDTSYSYDAVTSPFVADSGSDE